ncbi:MAG: 16S rRNA (cytidine(1402)-2'-O)-methyltransferase [Ignavibacteria bacterium]|nr:16S rRNA (cytidine(1402)-2'-O)-methyltransferase [Ignavibacteria bacterium]
MTYNYSNLFSEYLGNIEKGVLYVVSTPIGNLNDISFRAIHTLKNSDLIAVEDTRVSGFLMKTFGIESKMVSFYSRVEKNKTSRITDELKNNKTVSLISDAGTPCISDPGAKLVSECIENNIKVIPVPGASSIIHSLVLSGFNTKEFFFQGFLPQKGRESLYNELKSIKMTLILFESKFRIRKTVGELSRYFGNREIALCRELTKKFEEIIRGKGRELSKKINLIKEKGEFVIVVDNN